VSGDWTRESLSDDYVLTATLQVAVPLEIIRLRILDDDQRQWIARTAAQEIASHGDDILFKSKRAGDTARAFNHLATGLAALAYQPGGVTFAGLHWCPDHTQCEAAQAATREETP
jgi:hypothetical protein